MGVFAGEFYSESLRMTTQLKVIFPDRSNDVTPVILGEPSVLYLLHGLAGNAAEWPRFSKIEYYAKKYNLIVVMPEVQRSFYMDTAYGPKYFTYVSGELPDICNAWFKLPKEREKTFVAGESMGGMEHLNVLCVAPNGSAQLRRCQVCLTLHTRHVISFRKTGLMWNLARCEPYWGKKAL